MKNNPILKFDENKLFDKSNHLINLIKVKMQIWKNYLKLKLNKVKYLKH